MAYVSIPKDLSRVKSKFLFNLTKRQVVCFWRRMRWVSALRCCS